MSNTTPRQSTRTRKPSLKAQEAVPFPSPDNPPISLPAAPESDGSDAYQPSSSTSKKRYSAKEKGKGKAAKRAKVEKSDEEHKDVHEMEESDKEKGRGTRVPAQRKPASTKSSTSSRPWYDHKSAQLRPFVDIVPPIDPAKDTVIKMDGEPSIRTFDDALGFLKGLGGKTEEQWEVFKVAMASPLSEAERERSGAEVGKLREKLEPTFGFIPEPHMTPVGRISVWLAEPIKDKYKISDSDTMKIIDKLCQRYPSETAGYMETINAPMHGNTGVNVFDANPADPRNKKTPKEIRLLIEALIDAVGRLLLTPGISLLSSQKNIELQMRVIKTAIDRNVNFEAVFTENVNSNTRRHIGATAYRRGTTPENRVAQRDFVALYLHTCLWPYAVGPDIVRLDLLIAVTVALAKGSVDPVVGGVGSLKGGKKRSGGVMDHMTFSRRLEWETKNGAALAWGDYEAYEVAYMIRERLVPPEGLDPDATKIPGSDKDTIAAAVRSYQSKKGKKTMGPAALSAAAKKANETRGPAGRSAATKKGKKTMGPARRSAAMVKANETKGPAVRSAAIVKGKKTMGPAALSAAAKLGKEKMGPARRSAAVAKGNRARGAKADAAKKAEAEAGGSR